MKNILLKISIICSFILLLNFAAFAQEKSPAKIAAEDEIKNDIAKVRCKNSERLEAVKELFKQKGVKDEEISFEEIKGVQNVGNNYSVNNFGFDLR